MNTEDLDKDLVIVFFEDTTQQIMMSKNIVDMHDKDKGGEIFRLPKIVPFWCTENPDPEIINLDEFIDERIGAIKRDDHYEEYLFEKVDEKNYIGRNINWWKK